MPESMLNDPFSPPQVADRIRSLGVSKATMPVLQTLTLGLLAGGFISFGAMYYTVVMTQPGEAFGPTQFLGGVSFSLGFILVIIAGAELFTGINLIVMTWAAKKNIISGSDPKLGFSLFFQYVGRIYGSRTDLFLGVSFECQLRRWCNCY